MQSYDQPDALVKVPLLGAVGPLQFEVLQYRLEAEYGAKSRLESAAWSQIRWVREKDAAAAEALLKTGAAPVAATLNKPELAAWTHIARVLLNLHETVTRS